MPFLQTFCHHGFPNRLHINHLRIPTTAKKSAKLCKSLHHLQTFAPGSLSFVSHHPSIPPVTLPHSLFLSGPYTIHHTPSTLCPFTHCDLCLLPVPYLRLPCSLLLAGPYTIHHTLLTLFPFVVNSRLSSTARTARTGRIQPHPNRTKNIVFAKKSLPDFALIPCSSIAYRNPESSFFRTFSQICEKSGFSFQSEKNEWNRHGDNHRNQTKKTHEMGDAQFGGHDPTNLRKWSSDTSGSCTPNSCFLANSSKTVAIGEEKTIESTIIFRTGARGKPTRGDEK